MPNQHDKYNEKDVVKALQKEAKKIAKALDAFAKVKVSDPNLLDKLNKALDSIPNASEIVESIESFQSAARSSLDMALQVRVENIKKIETAYIRKMIGMGKAVREFDNGWRVGPLEIQVNRQSARISSWYNNENLIKWQSVADVEDIEKIENKSLDMLAKAAIPKDIIFQSFWDAYQAALTNKADKNDSQLVSITDFYRELRIVLVRQRIAGKSVYRKINKYVDFPKWAFLYNLDVYRSLFGAVKSEQMLTLQIGSMSEVSKGNGYIINGLDAESEYKVMCYIRPIIEVE